jgi:hypothetical protein
MTRRFYRKETVKFEVWAENIQIKNELYEAARLYALGAFRDDMARDYRCFDPKVEDGSVRGERLEAYNVDFGVVLACGSVSFDCTYCVEQSIIDTDIAYKDVEYIIRKSASLKREGKAQ